MRCSISRFLFKSDSGRRTRIWQATGIVAVAVAGVATGYLARPVSAATPQAKAPLVVLAAQQVGVRRCLSAINAVAVRGTTGALLQDVVVNWDRVTPDAAPFFSLTGMGNGSLRAALTITAIPTSKGSCAILVERISSGAASCRQVAATDLPQTAGASLIDGIDVYQNPDHPEETFTLIQNSGGCIVIRRQTSFEWPPRQ